MTDCTALSPTREVATPPVQQPRPSRLYLALFALALGGFAIGTTEFVTMGLLPQIADGVGVSIPTAGSVVSAYALGVVVGAPLIAMLGARVARKKMLLWLMIAFAAGNICSALAHNFGLLLAARFFAGLPHGAFFGIGSIVAASMVPLARRTWAVSMVLGGLTVANIAGVPVATLLGQRLGWEWPYLFVGLIALTCVAAVWRFVPPVPADRHASARGELSSLRRPQVWFALGIGTVGFGGMFATFSYITPTMTTLAHFSQSAMPIILVIYGVGMTTGALVAGRVARIGLLRGIFASMVFIAIVLASFGELARHKVTAVIAVFLLGTAASILVPMLQTRLMDVAANGQSLAAALNHSTLNIANALGAWLGGLVLAHGLGYEWPSRVGALLAVGGLVITAASAMVGRRQAVRTAS